jgi:arylformamidase
MLRTRSPRAYFEANYALRSVLPGFAEHVAEWERLSTESCFAGYAVHVERYGDHPRQTLEVFKAAPERTGKGLAMFIHGGFWRAMQREQSRFMATPFLKRGWDCVITEYRLMPAFRLADLVEDTVAALRHIAQNAQRLKLAQRRVIAGHSAGAHLALYGTMEARRRGVALGDSALLLFSGVFDIFPVRHTSIGDELAMPLEEAARWSIYAGADLGGQKAAFVVGGDETDDFQRQSLIAADYLGCGEGDGVIVVDDVNHLTLLTEFARNDALFEAVMATI